MVVCLCILKKAGAKMLRKLLFWKLYAVALLSYIIIYSKYLIFYHFLIRHE